VTDSLRRTLIVLTLTALAVPTGAWADPPPWAPAHGWRKKNDPNYVGYAGRQWERDYGVVEGRCLREAAGAAIGGVIGGAIGSQVGGGTGRKVAIVVGTVLGAAVGAKIGRDLDDADRACIGHALELGGERKSVRWSAGEVAYLLTPTGGFMKGSVPCRNYSLAVSRGKDRQDIKGVACRAGDGTWQVGA
jgi:surface antigen